MSIFRGPKEGTLPDGSVVATPGDIAEALTATQQAQAAAEAAQAAAEATLDNFDDRYLGAKSSDPTVDNDGDALIDGALYYNTVNLITRVYDLSSDSWSDLKPSASDQANINALGPVASQVETVGDNISDVTVVATDLSGTNTIGTVAGSIGNVNATGSDIANVNTAATDISSINTVATNISDVNSVGTNISDVSTVATDLSGTDAIGTVATDIADVTTAANNISNINIVAFDLNEAVSEIDTVANNITDVNTVGNNIADVNTVAGVSTEVTIVAADGADIGDVASNINAVDVVASDLAGAGFDYDLGSITGVTEGVVGTPDGFIITVFNIRDDIQTVAGIADDVVNLARTDQEVRDLFSGAGDISYNSSTGQFSVTTFKSSDFDSNFASKTTDDLTEGGNLYYTDSRVNARIDTRVDKTFVDALNVDADTLDGQQGTHYLDRANHTGTQTLSTISDSGALAALNTVDTAQIANQAVTDDKLATSLDLGSI